MTPLAVFDFPALNAGLNSISGVLLILGWLAIRSRAVRVHMTCMLSALGVSAVFLSSYLYYHIVIKAGQETRFAEQWPEAPASLGYLYYTILISHVFLAVVVTPMALYTAYLGLNNRLKRHVWLALDAADLALCVDHGRGRVLDALSSLSEGMTKRYNGGKKEGLYA